MSDGMRDLLVECQSVVASAQALGRVNDYLQRAEAEQRRELQLLRGWLDCAWEGWQTAFSAWKEQRGRPDKPHAG